LPGTRFFIVVKKKAPFIPITIIVIGVGVIFAMNARTHTPDPQDAAKPLTNSDASARPKDDPAAVSEALKASMKPQAKSTTPDSRNPVLLKPNPRGQSSNPVLATKPQQYHPVPTDGATSSQWYTSN
jgi:hypothetical protein